MEQQEKPHRILGHTVGCEISMEEIVQVAGGVSPEDYEPPVGTGPFKVGREILYMDIGPNPNL